MYPEGFHPVKIMHKRDYSGWATYIPRSVAGVRYYFADFGISVHVPEDAGADQKLVTGTMGRDQDPPELSATIPYDPFKLDIFIIGNMLDRELHKVIILFSVVTLEKLTDFQKFDNLGFLQPLAQWMTKDDPEQRPTAEAALLRWTEIRGKVSTAHMEWRPRPFDEHPLETFVLDVVSLYRLSMYFARACVQGLSRR